MIHDTFRENGCGDMSMILMVLIIIAFYRVNKQYDFTDDLDVWLIDVDFRSERDFGIFQSLSIDILSAPSGNDSFISKASLDHLGSIRRDML